MSLRIRRGTAEQRLTTPVDLGEIVLTTDTKKLYVGDGVNLGGVNILASSAGTGLTWNATTQTLNFTGLGTGIVNVLADTAPSLGGNLNLNNRNITGTGNINIAGTITATQFIGAVRLITDTTPTLGGNLILSNRSITGNGNISISGDISNGGISITGSLISPASGSNPGAIRINNAFQTMLQVAGLNTSGSLATTPQIQVLSSRGTLASPTASLPGDYVGIVNFGGYNSGSYQSASSIITQYDPTANMTNAFPASNLAFITNNGTGNNIAYFDKRGVFNAPILKATSYATNSLPTGQEEGFLVFDSTTKQFKGWNGTTWAVLG